MALDAIDFYFFKRAAGSRCPDAAFPGEIYDILGYGQREKIAVIARSEATKQSAYNKKIATLVPRSQ